MDLSNVPNEYIEDLITDKVKRLANKVKISYESADDCEPENVNKSIIEQQNSWRIIVNFKGKSFDFIYASPKTNGDTPRTEYILSSIFAGTRLYTTFKDVPENLYMQFKPLFPNFRAAIDYLEQMKKSHEEVKQLFGDSYEQYENAFTSFNPIFKHLKK